MYSVIGEKALIPIRRVVHWTIFKKKMALPEKTRNNYVVVAE